MQNSRQSCSELKPTHGEHIHIALFVGFQRRFVGLDVGKLLLPDIKSPSGMNGLGSICRKCRVFMGERAAANTYFDSVSRNVP